MRNKNYSCWQKPEKEETIKDNSSTEKMSLIDIAMSNLIKMKEATRLLKASAPTVRKYARLGHYKEYRFGEKLVFYDKEEILNFILKRFKTAEDS
ncbi:helix-turn-helix domain-containing protein [Dysgonomonas sp. ZJ279]|uniref:helix-turn-helix domain-containing protein n=1 Tax=Dysgonomonas sp. ZJ279 TaxID=2709796 RepID=UPI0013ED3FB1|nr:helix-turn-helix domain-containing protein [Dysgonomonas sp. ZJ279]